MAILPADFASFAASKAEGGSVAEATEPREGQRGFDSTLKDLLDSSDDTASNASVDNCTRPSQEDSDGGSDGGSDRKVPHVESCGETRVNVKVIIEQIAPDDIDLLTLEMVEVGRSAAVKGLEVTDIESSTLMQSNVIAMSKLGRFATEASLDIAASNTADDKPLIETLDRLAPPSPLVGARTEALGALSKAVDTANGGLKTEPQQLATGMTAYVRVLKSQGGGEAKLNLHPAELGRMSISVYTDGNDTRVAFVVETPQARQAIEAAIPRLREMLDSAGLSLSDSDVSEQRNRQPGESDGGSRQQNGGTSSSDGNDVPSHTAISLTLDPDRLVDTYI